MVKPESSSETYEARLFKGRSNEVRELTLYLPTYAGVSQLDRRLDTLAAPTAYVVRGKDRGSWP